MCPKTVLLVKRKTITFSVIVAIFAAMQSSETSCFFLKRTIRPPSPELSAISLSWHVACQAFWSLGTSKKLYTHMMYSIIDQCMFVWYISSYETRDYVEKNSYTVKSLLRMRMLCLCFCRYWKPELIENKLMFKNHSRNLIPFPYFHTTSRKQGLAKCRWEKNGEIKCARNFVE